LFDIQTFVLNCWSIPPK